LVYIVDGTDSEACAAGALTPSTAKTATKPRIPLRITTNV